MLLVPVQGTKGNGSGCLGVRRSRELKELGPKMDSEFSLQQGELVMGPLQCVCACTLPEWESGGLGHRMHRNWVYSSLGAVIFNSENRLVSPRLALLASV